MGEMMLTRNKAVPITDEIWTRLAATAKKYDVDLPEERESELIEK